MRFSTFAERALRRRILEPRRLEIEVVSRLNGPRSIATVRPVIGSV